MQYKLLATDASHWDVVDGLGARCGEVTRLATGFLATRSADGKVVKRFRMIDAIKETFGEENQYEIPK